MKRLVNVTRELAWLPQPGEARLYLTDEQPPRELCATAFGFVFVESHILLTRLTDRDWDIPGGRIEPDETPEDAVLREVWEETTARVEVIELLGVQELELWGPKPDNHPWPYPLSIQLYYLCRLVDFRPFQKNAESSERGLFAPELARALPTMHNHAPIYEEGLRRIQQQNQ